LGVRCYEQVLNLTLFSKRKIYYISLVLFLIHLAADAFGTFSAITTFSSLGEKVHTYGVIKSYTLAAVTISLILTQVIHKWIIILAVVGVGHSIFIDYQFSGCNVSLTVQGNFYIAVAIMIVGWFNFTKIKLE